MAEATSTICSVARRRLRGETQKEIGEALGRSPGTVARAMKTETFQRKTASLEQMKDEEFAHLEAKAEQAELDGVAQLRKSRNASADVILDLMKTGERDTVRLSAAKFVFHEGADPEEIQRKVETGSLLSVKVQTLLLAVLQESVDGTPDGPVAGSEPATNQT